MACEWLDEGSEKLSTASTEGCDWWQSFGDETLNCLIEQAACQNLSLHAMATRVFAAKAELGIAQGNLFPQVQRVKGKKIRSRQSDNLGPGAVVTDESSGVSSGSRKGDVYSTSFDIGWELDIWGRYRRAIQSTRATHCAAIASYDDFLVMLCAQVADAYITLRSAQERLRITYSNAEIQGRTLEIASVRQRNGAVTQLDVEQAKRLLHNTESQIPSLQNAIRHSSNSLCLLLGLIPGDLDDCFLDKAPIPKAPQEVAIGIPSELLRRRPDIREAEYLALAQCARIGVAQSALYPHFALVGTFGLSSSNFSDLFSSASRFRQYGPWIQWDIFNYDRLKNAVRVEDARFQELIFSYEEKVLAAQAEVEDAISSFIRSQESVETLEKSAKAAEAATELALIQYREGAVDYTTVLTTEEALLLQQDRLVIAQTEIAKSLVALYKALGGGWQLRCGDDLLPKEVSCEMKCRTDWGCLLN